MACASVPTCSTACAPSSTPRDTRSRSSGRAKTTRRVRSSTACHGIAVTCQRRRSPPSSSSHAVRTSGVRRRTMAATPMRAIRPSSRHRSSCTRACRSRSRSCAMARTRPLSAPSCSSACARCCPDCRHRQTAGLNSGDFRRCACLSTPSARRTRSALMASRRCSSRATRSARTARASTAVTRARATRRSSCLHSLALTPRGRAHRRPRCEAPAD
mmetsp:Transcript_9492/g.29986  ORF Transcript_9492/g.29986 Transcript_9492/m.29986 type:complete len:215 (-) Transcript_9492:91-735(-)